MGSCSPGRSCATQGGMQSSTVGYMDTHLPPQARGLSVSRGSHGVCTSLWIVVLWGARDLERGAAGGQS